MNRPECPCGCGRYQECSWSPYWQDETEEQDPGFRLGAMPDQVILGLSDGYDDAQVDTVVSELIRLRGFLRDRGLFAEAYPEGFVS